MKPTTLLATATLLALSACSEPAAPPAAQDEPAMLPPASAMLEAGAGLETATSVAFTEGPAADAEGNVYFSEITNNRILKYTPGAAGYTEFRNPSNRANGLAFDAQGRLLACEGNSNDGGRRVTRSDMATGAVEVLADKFEGKRLNSPNDLVVSQDGRVYFTDPRYGSQDGRELDTEDVYRIDPDGTLARAATAPDVNKPNGIAISPDGKTLYVADTQPGPTREARVMAFDIGADGSLSNPRQHYSFGSGRGIDGMAIDVEGNIYGAAGRMAGAPENDAGVYIISPQGQLSGFVRVPEDSVTNCNFGGPDLRTLYITAGKTLFSVRTKNRGFLVYPPAGAP